MCSTPKVPNHFNLSGLTDEEIFRVVMLLICNKGRGYGVGTSPFATPPLKAAPDGERREYSEHAFSGKTFGTSYKKVRKSHVKSSKHMAIYEHIHTNIYTFDNRFETQISK